MECTSDLWCLHVDEERIQAASRLGGYQRPPVVPELLPPALLATSSLTKHLAVLSLNREISCAHINQPLSSWKAQFSPGQPCLKEKALWQEGKKYLPLFILRHGTWQSFPLLKCYFIPCSPIMKIILLRQETRKTQRSSFLFLSPEKVWLVLFERWLRTHLSWLFHFGACAALLHLGNQMSPVVNKSSLERCHRRRSVISSSR